MSRVADSNTEQLNEAKHVDFHIKGETTPGAAWMELRDKLADGAQSVEVIRGDNDGFILRTWWDSRKDESNSVDV